MDFENQEVLEHFILEDKHLIEQYKDESELPKKVRIEASTLCQLNCVMCHMKREPEEVKKGCGFGTLKIDDLKNFIENNDIERVELSNNGELFTNPDIIPILKYLHEKNVTICVQNGTNLNTLTDETARSIVESQVKYLVISIDGASQETYSIYRRNGDFNKVLNNIRKINYYKKIFHSEYPILTYKFIVFGHNEHEIEKAKQIAKDLKMEIAFSKNGYPSYSPVQNPEKVISETGLDDIDISPSHRLDEYNNHLSNWFFCSMLWNDPQINYDGRILGCCYLYNDDFAGNVFKDGYLKAMNNPKILYAKAMLTNNAKPAKDIPCTHCWVYKDLVKNNNFMKSPKLYPEYNISI